MASRYFRGSVKSLLVGLAIMAAVGVFFFDSLAWGDDMPWWGWVLYLASLVGVGFVVGAIERERRQ